MKRCLLLVVPVLMAAGCSGSSGDNQIRPKLFQKDISCAEFRAKLPAGYVAKFINVPEQPGNDSGPQIKIFYYYKSPLKGRVTLFLNGGPGSSSQSSFNLMEKATKSFGVQDQMTFVYMDQRGTGCSSDYPLAATDDEMYERGKWYGTRGIVSDAEQIRKALVGDQPWSIFGQSYGAMIAHRYALMAPQSLERVIAYANAITPDHYARLKDRINSQIDIWPAYFAAYPADQAKMVSLKNQLSMQVCVPVLNDKDCGITLVDPLVSFFLGFHDTWPLLHNRLDRLLVNSVVQTDYLTKFANAFADGDEVTVQHGRGIAAINYYDRDVVPMSEMFCDDVRKDWNTAHPNGSFGDFLTECSGALQQGWTYSSYWRAANHFKGLHDPMSFYNLRQALSQKSKTFFHLYSADLDPYVPARSFSEEVQALGDVLTYRNFADVGHDGYYTKKEVFDDLLAP